MSRLFLRRLPILGLAAMLWGCQTGTTLSPEQAALQSYTLEAARTAEARHDYKGAAGQFARLSAQDPKNVDLALAAARNLRRTGEPQKGLMALEAVLAAGPVNAAVLLEAGLCYAENGQLVQAEPILRQARDLAPDDWRTHTALAVVLERQGRALPALAAFEAAAKAAPPGTPEAINNLAMAYALAGRIDEAIALLKGAGPAAPAQVRRNLEILLGMKG